MIQYSTKVTFVRHVAYSIAQFFVIRRVRAARFSDDEGTKPVLASVYTAQYSNKYKKCPVAKFKVLQQLQLS